MARPSAVLLDFDGTICDLFEGFDLAPVRERLREALARHDLADLADGDDLFAIPAQVSDLAQDGQRAALLREVDELLTGAEVAAVPTGRLVAGVGRAVRRLSETGVALAVVTNNAPATVHAFAATRLPELRSAVVVGREATRPEVMKPSPHPVLAALARLGLEPGSAVMVGDSLADVAAARAAGCAVVGMGSKPHRWERLTAVLAPGRVVRDFDGLLALLDVP